MTTSTDEDRQDQIRVCDFCGRSPPPGEPFGTARAYICYPDEDGGIDRSQSGSSGPSGVETVRICLGCAFSHEPTPEETDVDVRRPGRCDLCGHVGPTLGGNTGEGYYCLQDIMSWSVEIRGFEGTVHVCRDCTPIVSWDLYRREGVDYGREEAMEVPVRAEVGTGRAGDVQNAGAAPTPDQVTLGEWGER